MQKIRHILIVLGMLLCSVTSAAAQVSIGIGLPNVSIGINVPVYPELVLVPGYPVYYAPALEANFFFYDGMYWVYQNDNWYESPWYNGPWWFVAPEAVPLFILRIPVRYYLQPPVYFRGWGMNAPPRWGEHWGHDWERHRSGWNKWRRGTAPAPAPLPTYQRHYSGDRYPQHVEQLQELQQRNYRYQPRDPVVRRHYRERAMQGAPAQQERQRTPEEGGPRQPDIQRSMPPRQVAPAAPRVQTPQGRVEDVQRSAPASPQPPSRQLPAAPRLPTAPQQGQPAVQDHRQPPQPALDQRERQMERSQRREERQRDKDATREKKRDKQEQERGRDGNE